LVDVSVFRLFFWLFDLASLLAPFFELKPALLAALSFVFEPCALALVLGFVSLGARKREGGLGSSGKTGRSGSSSVSLDLFFSLMIWSKYKNGQKCQIRNLIQFMVK